MSAKRQRSDLAGHANHGHCASHFGYYWTSSPTDEDGNHGATNHGPMAAEVMVRRGLDIPVEKWLDEYVGHIDAGDWREALGDHHRVADWTAYFRAELRRAPWQTC
jgi:hypothetical protein